MKIRLDFVTNSSSSSFIAIVQKCTLSEYINGAVPPDREVVMWGGYVNDGYDLISLDKEMAEFIDQHIDEFDSYDGPHGDCMIVLSRSWDDSSRTELTLDTDALSKASPKFGAVRVVAGEVDYHCTDSLQDLKDRYLGG